MMQVILSWTSLWKSCGEVVWPKAENTGRHSDPGKNSEVLTHLQGHSANNFSVSWFLPFQGSPTPWTASRTSRCGCATATASSSARRWRCTRPCSPSSEAAPRSWTSGAGACRVNTGQANQNSLTFPWLEKVFWFFPEFPDWWTLSKPGSTSQEKVGHGVWIPILRRIQTRPTEARSALPWVCPRIILKFYTFCMEPQIKNEVSVWHIEFQPSFFEHPLFCKTAIPMARSCQAMQASSCRREQKCFPVCLWKQMFREDRIHRVQGRIQAAQGAWYRRFRCPPPRNRTKADTGPFAEKQCGFPGPKSWIHTWVSLWFLPSFWQFCGNPQNALFWPNNNQFLNFSNSEEERMQY